MHAKKNLTLTVILLMVALPCSPFGKPKEPEVIVLTKTQDAYAALGEIVPALCMLPCVGTSAVDPALPAKIDDALTRALIETGTAKPVLMTKWLFVTYGKKHAPTPFTLMSAIAAEQYAVLLEGVCRPFVFRNGDLYALRIGFYPLSGSSQYPISVFRLFRNEAEITDVIASCVDEFKSRFFAKDTAKKKKFIVSDFKLEIKTLVELESSEFDFVSAPFITISGVPLKQEDDYFSVVMGYALESTTMASVMRPSDFAGYSETDFTVDQNADYALQGRVQISDQMSILYVTVTDAKTGAKIASLRHPLKDCSLAEIWGASRQVILALAKYVFPANGYGVVPPLAFPAPPVSDRGFFAHGMFVGWNALSDMLLPIGNHKIETGSFTRPGAPSPKENETVRDFFVLLADEKFVYTDRQGEYIWNLQTK